MFNNQKEKSSLKRKMGKGHKVRYFKSKIHEYVQKTFQLAKEMRIKTIFILLNWHCFEDKI